MKAALRLPEIPILLSLLLLLSTPAATIAQDHQEADTTRTHLIAAARDIMESARFCDLITLDETGRPRSRVMDPFPPGDDMVFWLGTSRMSRKVGQIRNDPRVTLQYFAPEAGAYVTISGTAELVDDPEERALKWKDGWEAFYPDREAYLLIKVTPDWLEVVSSKHGIRGNPESMKPLVVAF